MDPTPPVSEESPLQMGEETRDYPEALQNGEGIDRRRFGPYVLQTRIGIGGQGEVWKAIQVEPIVRVVALKVLPASATLDPERLQGFRREAEHGGRLTGPSILPVYDFGVAAGRPYISMPLIDGYSLREVVHQRRRRKLGKQVEQSHPIASLPEPEYQKEICRLLARIARAVGDSHAAKILHRDIKPGNILIDRAGGDRIYLSDFGLSRDLDATGSAHSGFQPGTPIYMAPERLLALPDSDAIPADIFSLGATVYEALTLELPFTIPDGMPLAAWPAYLAGSEPARPRELNAKLPRDIEAVILKAIDPNPALRYESAVELADDLDRFARGEPVHAHPVGPARRLLRRIAKRKRLVTSLVIAAAVIATLAFVRMSFSALAVELRAQARDHLSRDEHIEAGRLAYQALGFDASHPDNVLLFREITKEVITETQESADNTNIDHALQWFRSWAALAKSQAGAAHKDVRAEFAKELGLLEFDVYSDVTDTLVTFHAVYSDGRPRPQLPLYQFDAMTPESPARLGEVIDGLYWVTAKAPGGRFVEFLYQPPVGVASDRIPKLALHPRTTAEATAGMVEIKGGLLTASDATVSGRKIRPNDVSIEDFHLDATEVTNRDFIHYLESIGDRVTAVKIWPKTGHPEPESLDRPVTGVTYDQARDYAASRGCRLPSADELEWAARGNSRIEAPAKAPVDWKPDGLDWTNLHPVRSVVLDQTRTGSGETLFGLFGNAGELTCFRYRPWAYDTAKPRDLAEAQRPQRRRGASHLVGSCILRCGLAPTETSNDPVLLGYSGQGLIPPNVTHPTVGFRCARSARPLIQSSSSNE